MKRHDKQRIVASAHDCAGNLAKVWGNHGLGLALVARFFGDDPWITAMELAAGSAESEDTIRRRLDQLVEIGRVRVGKRGRTTVFKAHRKWAARTWDLINSFLLYANCA